MTPLILSQRCKTLLRIEIWSLTLLNTPKKISPLTISHSKRVKRSASTWEIVLSQRLLLALLEELSSWRLLQDHLDLLLLQVAITWVSQVLKLRLNLSLQELLLAVLIVLEALVLLATSQLQLPIMILLETLEVSEDLEAQHKPRQLNLAGLMGLIC